MGMVIKELRYDQATALQSLRDAVAEGKRRICMQAPTGFGKTVLASVLVTNALQRNKRVLYTVPTISLVDQTVEMFHTQGIDDVGVIQADHHMTNWSQPVQIASVQTLMKHNIPQADVVLVDECHRWFRFYERWLSKDKMPEWGDVPFIGLSATPWTKGLGSWFDHFHRASTTQEMIDGGHLSPFKVFAPTHPDLSGIRIVAGDYHEGELSAKMSDGRLVADAVDTWIRLSEGRATLCYAVDRAHAKHLQLNFQAAGIPCGYIDAFTDKATKRSRKTGEWIEGREQIKRKFHSGEYKVVCSVGTLTVGIDWDVRCISMCRPTKSDMLFVQIIGRGLRNAEGKDHCLILDHSDNHQRLGFVTDIDASYIGLHDGKTPQHENRTEGIRLPKECPQCAYLKPPKMALCPSCGFLAQVQNKVKPDEGELRELRPQPKVKARPARDFTIADKAQFFAELKAYARTKGYKPGWAANQYREKMGVWPANEIKDIVPAGSISAETHQWVKSRMIAFAKSKQGRFKERDLFNGPGAE
jgi:superfamily II DNA or RNA helicase